MAGTLGAQWSLPGFHHLDRTVELGKEGQPNSRVFAIPGVTVTQCLQMSMETPKYCLLKCSENKRTQKPPPACQVIE